MSIFESTPHPTRPFEFKAPGIPAIEFNPFLRKVMNFDRPMRAFHVAYSNVIYPTPVIRADWATFGPYEGRAHAMQCPQRQAETGDGIADWLVTTAWAMGARFIAHADLPPGSIFTGLNNQSYSPMILQVDRIMRPNIHERYTIPFDTKDFYHQAAKHGVTMWTFDVSGPRWSTLSPAKRQEILAADPTMRPRADGFRSLPLDPTVLERIKGVPRDLVSFAEAVSFKGPRFVPRSRVQQDDEIV